jgi:hypothetical protein
MVTPTNTLASRATTGMFDVLAMKISFSLSGRPLFGSLRSRKLRRTSAISLPRSPQPM